MPTVEPLQLQTPLSSVPSIGPQRALLWSRLELHTCGDLLFYFPRDYELIPAATSLAELAQSAHRGLKTASVVGRVVESERRALADGRFVVNALIQDDTGYARLTFYNQPYRLDQLQRGARVMATGDFRATVSTIQMNHPRLIVLAEDEDPPGAGLQPIYGLTEGLKQAEVRRTVRTVLAGVIDEVPEVLPDDLRAKLQVGGIRAALRAIHQPADTNDRDSARRRFIIQELLVLQLALAMRRRRLTTDLRAPPLPPSPKINARIERIFPFALTADQQRAIEEVGQDMSRQFPMNRLLQGDVGSGKTVVAQYALLLAVAHQHQAAFMVPTEVLAQQHFQTLTKSLAASRVRLGLLTGGMSAVDRRTTLAALAAGELDLIIGTQALVSPDVEFAKLGLVIIDEQHKFGVAQRARLRRGGLDPHSLVLSATPIPRTVAMTWFGDLDVSQLKEKPPGRAPVHTYLSRDGWRDRWWQFVSDRLDEGRQAYIVAPRISAEAEPDTSSVERIYAELQAGPLRGFRLALLHGRLGSREKVDVIERFAQGRVQVLVTTTVIEVGIDVPNASVMTILGAEQFGLAQLHQLRGRVGRGGHPGYVCVFTDGPDDPQEHERLRAFAATEDGFALAEADVRMRGPGDLLGVRQTGMPPLRIADPLRDVAELEAAREVARELIDHDPELAVPGFERLRAQVLRRYGETLELGDIA